MEPYVITVGSLAGLLATLGIVAGVTLKRDRDRQRYERLPALWRRYRLHAHYGRDLICLHDSNGLLEYVSPSVTKLLGYQPSELETRSFYAIVDADHRSELRDKIEREVLEKGGELTCRIRARKKNGSLIWLELECTPEREHDTSVRYITASRDVTRLQKAKRALAEGKRSTWPDAAGIQNLSHEMRTPLTGILGFADLLAGDLKEEQRRFARLIRASGERLMTSVNTLMEYSSLNGDAFQLDRKRLDVPKLVGKQVDKYRDAAEEKGIVLQTVADQTSLLAEADERAVASVASHLIDNAIKFSDDGGVVTVGIHEAGDEVLLRVSDNGIGISEEFIPRLFDPFQQESTGLSRDYEGIGLGLSIAKRLVDLHGGRILVDSKKGRGSTFTVCLPKGSRSEPERHRGLQRRHAQKENYRSRSAAPLRKVLAVDDNGPMRKIITRHLRDRFDVTTAENSTEALRLARTMDFDLVLIDINLGADDDGTDLLKALREVPGYVRVAMVAITAYALPGERLIFLREGFDGFVAKPFTREQLLEEIDRLRKKIEGARSRRAAA